MIKDAIDMAQEELRICGRSDLKVVDVKPTRHPLTVTVVYEDGHESEWSGLIAAELRKALKK